MSTDNSELTQLQAAIMALEGQRSVLGDDTIETLLGPLRERLAALTAQAQPDQQRKLTTVLFADVSGFTAMSEMMDAEVIAGVMNDLWALVDGAIISHGGRIDKHIGDAVMAMWGAEGIREDDPEQAVRAALAMQEALDTFCQSHNIPMAMRIGINTGPVLLGQVGTTGEYTALGDTVNLASRLESAAPVGQVLISHDTYRHIRGVFSVTAQAPLVIKGKTDPVQTYVVRQAKPRAFRLTTRGVEGIETQMIGRDREFGLLQLAFVNAVETAETQALHVIGDAGVGKSRLLYEFSNWLELRPEEIYYFKGRATPNTQNVPYSLFRNLFAYRFDILDSDSAAVAMEKFRAGTVEILPPEQADIVGHWLGFDFSASEAVTNLLGSLDFGTVARAHLVRYFRTLASAEPLVIFLEDIHWADDQSLELATHLITAIDQAHLLLLTLSRPSLFERHPSWGEGLSSLQRISLRPLTRRSSQALVDEILRRAQNVPDPLRDLVVDTAEGNPFYLEELIKMLIEQGVIERGGAEEQGSEVDALSSTPLLPGAPTPPPPSHAPEEVWQVRTDRLATLEIPHTLTGLLQARMDGLPPAEREALQRAAVVGRLFWDDAVAELSPVRRADLSAALESIRSRELIFRHERSAFARTQEYVFKHALLRDVVYETVLIKYRAEFHRRVARWLEVNAGERIGEYLGLIAEHFAQAGEYDRAAEYEYRAGEQALRTSAFHAARTAFERGLALRERSGTPPAGSLPYHLKLGDVCVRLSDFQLAESELTHALSLARADNDIEAQAEALGILATVVRSVGRVDEVDALMEEALPLARQAGGLTLTRVLTGLASHEWQSGHLDAAEEHANEARSLAHQIGHISQEIEATISLGVIAGLRGDFDSSIRHFEDSIILSRQNGDRYREALSEANLGATKQYARDFAGAIIHYRASFELCRELGAVERMAIVAHNLADVYAAMDQLEEAHHFVRECLRLSRQVGAVPLQLAALVPLADIMVKEGSMGRALELIGLCRNHPSTPQQKQTGIEQALGTIHLDEAQIASGLAAGATLDLDTVVQAILDGKW